MTYKRKLIEVALPLEAINSACKPETENPFLRNHPRAMAVWWARTPLVACRAMLFASLVDDPSSHPEKFPTEEDQERERKRLFAIIEELVRWENSNDEKVLAAAKAEIMRSTDGHPPPILDPFCGRGSIPLEAQRLGLEAHASDLNPVAVLITRALIEIPPKFAGQPPVNPEAQSRLGTATWKGARGLADDIHYYGKWMREEAERRIGHLYPKVNLPPEHGGGEATVIAWLWARTVKCPNPACGARMPLVRSFWLSTKKSKKSWIEPIIDHINKSVRFEVRTGEGQPIDGTVNRQGARCIVCASPVPFTHVRAEGKAGRMDAQLMAIVAEGARGRVYVAANEAHEAIAEKASPENVPETSLPAQALGFRVQAYGMTRHCDLFTQRQLVALTTLGDLVSEARDKVLKDAATGGVPDDDRPLSEGGANAPAYADALGTYLGLAFSRLIDYHCTLTTWNPTNENVRNVFQRQALPMTWDFPEADPLWKGLGMDASSGWIADALQALPAGTVSAGAVTQMDATENLPQVFNPLVSTDPPYYDNIGYADISDFFYVWLRRALRDTWSTTFATLLTPKAQELIATPYRFDGDLGRANAHFENGFIKSFAHMARVSSSDYPLTVYYAYKQSEDGSRGDNSASSGWEKMLIGLILSGFQVIGTWPVRTTKKARSVARGTNALASAIVLACRLRPNDSPLATKREFVGALRRELPNALRNLQHGNIAPVDLAQASIGPGMAVFSQYSKIIEADGSAMRVRTALELINQVLSEVLTGHDDEYDSSTRWAIVWFEQFGMRESLYDRAHDLARAQGIAVDGLVRDGIVYAHGGKARLLRPDELLDNWDPRTDSRVRVWEVTHYLVRALEAEGEQGAASVLKKIGSLGDIARDLAYRLYVTCERKKWGQEALGYNALVVAWPEIQRLAGREPTTKEQVQLSI